MKIKASATALAVAAVLGFTTISSGVLAQEAERRMMPPPRMHMGHDRLQLSDEQKELFKQMREDTQENRAKLRELQQQLRDLIHSDSYSEGEAMNIAFAISEIQQANMVAHANAQHAFYASLSEEQRAKMEAREQRMKELPKHRRRGPTQTPDQGTAEQ